MGDTGLHRTHDSSFAIAISFGVELRAKVLCGGQICPRVSITIDVYLNRKLYLLASLAEFKAKVFE
jgi:hypothetical protein